MFFSVVNTSATVSLIYEYEVLSLEVFYQIDQTIRDMYKIKFSLHVLIKENSLPS